MPFFWFRFHKWAIEFVRLVVNMGGMHNISNLLLCTTHKGMARHVTSKTHRNDEFSTKSAMLNLVVTISFLNGPVSGREKRWPWLKRQNPCFELKTANFSVIIFWAENLYSSVVLHADYEYENNFSQLDPTHMLLSLKLWLHKILFIRNTVHAR